jgi:hypothetical protein
MPGEPSGGRSSEPSARSVRAWLGLAAGAPATRWAAPLRAPSRKGPRGVSAPETGEAAGSGFETAWHFEAAVEQNVDAGRFSETTSTRRREPIEVRAAHGGSVATHAVPTPRQRADPNDANTDSHSGARRKQSRPSSTGQPDEHAPVAAPPPGIAMRDEHSETIVPAPAPVTAAQAWAAGLPDASSHVRPPDAVVPGATPSSEIPPGNSTNQGPGQPALDADAAPGALPLSAQLEQLRRTVRDLAASMETMRSRDGIKDRSSRGGRSSQQPRVIVLSPSAEGSAPARAFWERSRSGHLSLGSGR